MAPMVAISSSRSKKRLVGQALIEKGRISAGYAGENKKPEKNLKFHHNSSQRINQRYDFSEHPHRRRR